MITKFKAWLAERREAKYQRIWDNKSDESIFHAHKDATDWLALEDGWKFLPPEKRFKLPESLRDSCNMRLEKYIQPQMAKRGL